MKVLFLSQIVPYPPHGGVLQRGYNIIRELGEEATVHLLAFIHPDELPTQASREDSRVALQKHCASVEYFSLWPKASPLHRVAGLAAGAISSKPFSVLAHHSTAFRRRVRELVVNGGFDVIHVDTIALAQFLPEETPVATVLTHHNIESQLMERRAEAEPHALARWYVRREAVKLRAYEEAMLNRFDVNICVSAADEAMLKQRMPGVQTAVVTNGVDVEYFTPDDREHNPVLIYTGGMNMFANRDAVLYFLERIWPQVRRWVPDVQFFAVGQEPPKDLLAIAERDKQVVATGYVNDIRPLVREAAVYVVPLRVGGGTRLKVLDALAMGKAMVTTSIGCEGIEVNADEHVIIADEPDQFAEQTVRLLMDRTRRIELGRAARALVERQYSWKNVGRQLLDAYRVARERREARA